MNPFLKAALLTVVVVILAAMLVSQVDAWRTQELKGRIDQVVLQSESNRLLQRMSALVPADERCGFLQSSGEVQKERAYGLAMRIQDYQRANFFGSEYAELKQTYFVSLSDLYLFTLEKNRDCPQNREAVLIYFYREKDCPECQAQSAVLERIGARCSGMRIFAFPTDADYLFLRPIREQYGIGQTPSMAIWPDKRLNGMQDDQSVIRALQASGAKCQ